MRRNLDQERAESAWKVVACYDGDHKEFSNLCKQTSARILNCGLCPALAFLEAKGHSALLDTIGEHVFRKKVNDLVQRLIGFDVSKLRRATDETLAYLGWLARLAEVKKKEEEKTK